MELVEQLHGAVKVAKVSGRIDQTTAALFQDLLAPLLATVKAGAARCCWISRVSTTSAASACGC